VNDGRGYQRGGAERAEEAERERGGEEEKRKRGVLKHREHREHREEMREKREKREKREEEGGREDFFIGRGRGRVGLIGGACSVCLSQCFFAAAPLSALCSLCSLCLNSCWT